METVLNKLQEGVKYPRFERDATRIINDLVTHITKERGVYSSSIEPNPNEHKIWFNTNTNTLNIYENGRWNSISGGGSGGGNTEYLSNIKTISMISGFISGVSTLNINSGGSISASGASINGATISGANISGGEIYGASLSNATLTGSINASGATINDVTLNGGTISGVTIGSSCRLNVGGGIISGGGINGVTLIGSISASGANINNPTFTGNVNINSGGQFIYAGNTILTYTGTISNPVLMPYGGNLGYDNSQFKICGITLTGGDFQKLKSL